MGEGQEVGLGHMITPNFFVPKCRDHYYVLSNLFERLEESVLK